MTVLSLITQTFTYPSWSVDRLPSLVGKVAIVTGASAGLGKLTALELARKGAHVFCVGRSASKTQAVVDDIKAETGNDKVEMLLADFMDLAAVEAAADAFLARGLSLDILVNNAGVMGLPWQVSKQGIESQFAVNVFATTVFTMRLLPAIKKASTSRIVNLSSILHASAKTGISYETFNDKSVFDTMEHYNETKLAAIHFTRELQRRLEAAGVSHVLVNAVHPGVVKTDLFHMVPDDMWQSVAGRIGRFMMIPPESGAVTQIYVAGAADIEAKQIRAKYFVPYAAMATPSKIALDAVAAKKTWDWMQEILQKQYRGDWSYGL